MRYTRLWLVVGWLLASGSVHGQSVRQNSPHPEQAPLRTGSAAAAQTPDLSRVGKLIVTYTNELRRRKGRGKLSLNADLSRAAEYFADFMARTDKYSHTADGKEPWQRAAACGYEYCILLENIAYEYSSAGFGEEQLARKFMSAWERSPEHRKNLLDPDLDDIGVGVAYSKKTGRYCAVQDFGRPKSRAITFQVANETDADVKYSVDGKDFVLPPRYTRSHERCRPPTLAFHLKAGKEAAPSKGKEVLHPSNRDRFIVRCDSSGQPAVEKEPFGSRR